MLSFASWLMIVWAKALVLPVTLGTVDTLLAGVATRLVLRAAERDRIDAASGFGDVRENLVFG